MGAFFNYYRGGSHVRRTSSRLSLFLGQHTNSRRNQRRAAIKAAGGIRQFKRQQRAERANRG